MLLLVRIAAFLLLVAHRCSSFSFSFPPPPPQQHPEVAAIHDVATVEKQKALDFQTGRFQLSPSFLLSASSGLEPPAVQTQSQQMNDAMVIKTMRGTQWRVNEDRVINDRLSFGPSSATFFGKNSPRYCKSVVTFGGFSGVDNKGTVGVEYFCDKAGGGGTGTTTAVTTKTAKGRWVSKPSRLARGSVQLSARWKVKCPEEGGKSIIYKGFIDADKIIGRNGKSVNAEMVGVILTGEDVNREKVIGKFTADFVRQLSEAEEREIANNLGGGAVPTMEIVSVATNDKSSPPTDESIAKSENSGGDRSPTGVAPILEESDNAIERLPIALSPQ